MHTDCTAAFASLAVIDALDLTGDVLIDDLDRWAVPVTALQTQTWICIREDYAA